VAQALLPVMVFLMTNKHVERRRRVGTDYKKIKAL
jgi:hypothetical protein